MPDKSTEYTRAKTAFEKADAAREKIDAKLKTFRVTVENLEAELRSATRTSDYLFMHPALAEARENGTDDEPKPEPEAEPEPHSEADSKPEPEVEQVKERLATKRAARAAKAPEVEPEAAPPVSDQEWEAAAPSSVDPFGEPDSAPAFPATPAPSLAPVTDPFGSVGSRFD